MGYDVQGRFQVIKGQVIGLLPQNGPAAADADTVAKDDSGDSQA